MNDKQISQIYRWLGFPVLARQLAPLKLKHQMFCINKLNTLQHIVCIGPERVIIHNAVGDNLAEGIDIFDAVLDFINKHLS